MKVLVIGNVPKDTDLQRLADFLTEDAEAMLGRDKTDSTKAVYVEVTIGEGEPVEGCGGDCSCNK